MKQEFKEIKVQSGDDMMYLGMRVQRNMDGSIILSMDRLLDEMLEGITVSASSPALSCLFDNDPQSPLLTDQRKDVIHSKIAKLLYFAQRIRFEISVAVAVLNSAANSALLLRAVEYESRLRSRSSCHLLHETRVYQAL